MNLIFELGILFLICMAGEGIATLLPIMIPASVISLILLLILLLRKLDLRTFHFASLRLSAFYLL